MMGAEAIKAEWVSGVGRLLAIGSSLVLTGSPRAVAQEPAGEHPDPMEVGMSTSSTAHGNCERCCKDSHNRQILRPCQNAKRRGPSLASWPAATTLVIRRAILALSKLNDAGAVASTPTQMRAAPEGSAPAGCTESGVTVRSCAIASKSTTKEGASGRSSGRLNAHPTGLANCRTVVVGQAVRLSCWICRTSAQAVTACEYLLSLLSGT